MNSTKLALVSPLLGLESPAAEIIRVNQSDNIYHSVHTDHVMFTVDILHILVKIRYS